jgi:hypothetical protein
MADGVRKDDALDGVQRKQEGRPNREWLAGLKFMGYGSVVLEGPKFPP